MSFINKFFIKFFSKLVVVDEFGNEYFEGRKKTFFGKNKRFVIYNGIQETSKIPPNYHAWLHYLTDEIPSKVKIYDWQEDYLPNLSGTTYVDAESNKYKSDSYCAWKPNN